MWEDGYLESLDLRKDTWVIPLMLFLGLSWTHSRNERGAVSRRSGFPSWSWTGWRAAADKLLWLGFANGRPYCRGGGTACELLRDEKWCVELEVKDGTILTWDDFIRIGPSGRQERLSRFLHVTAWTTPVQIVAAHPPDDKHPKNLDIVLSRGTAGVFELTIR
jgi:hypothetical protein